jgi:hypothetical protein
MSERNGENRPEIWHAANQRPEQRKLSNDQRELDFTCAAEYQHQNQRTHNREYIGDPQPEFRAGIAFVANLQQHAPRNAAQKNHRHRNGNERHNEREEEELGVHGYFSVALTVEIAEQALCAQPLLAATARDASRNACRWLWRAHAANQFMT